MEPILPLSVQHYSAHCFQPEHLLKSTFKANPIGKAPTKQTNFVWQAFKVLLVKHNVCQFGHHTNMLDKLFFACDKQKMFLKSFKNIDKQYVLVKQCLSW